MNKKLFFVLFLSQSVMAITPSEFNSALIEDLDEDIKQERYLDQKQRMSNPSRTPASVDQDFNMNDYLKKNKVNGLHEKW